MGGRPSKVQASVQPKPVGGADTASALASASASSSSSEGPLLRAAPAVASENEGPVIDQDRILTDANLVAIVKVFVVDSLPSYELPWQQEEQIQFTGTGFVIEGGLVVTNAHVVENAVSARVRREGDPRKYRAERVSIAHECDLALLRVIDTAFWKSHGKDVALPLQEPSLIPRIGDAVVAVGYPQGGDNISVTKGVVSRIDTMRYSDHESSSRLLVVQIDAAINPGNSGGPVFDSNGRVCGVAFCKDNDDGTDNIGYIIPIAVLQRFTTQVADLGNWPGVCGLGFQFQCLENDTHRKALQMEEDQTGVLVTGVAPLAPLAQCLKQGDVLLAIDDVPIANDGSAQLYPTGQGGRNDRQRVRFEHLITSRLCGDSVRLALLRDAAVTTAEVKVGPVPRLIPLFHGFDAWPTYCIIGGLVFAPLSAPLVDTMDMSDTVLYLAYQHLSEGGIEKKDPDQQVIILQRVLISDAVNYGYEQVAPALLKNVNGSAVKNMKALVDLIDRCKEGFLTFEFVNSKKIVLDVADCRRTEKELLSANAIASRLSTDLQNR